MPIQIRPIRVQGNVAFVPLTQGYEAIIDIEDIPLVEGRNWSAKVNAHTVYATRTSETQGKKRSVAMHRLLAGEPNGMEVDHRDCDGLNNCRANLRVATKAQNMHNRQLERRNTSGFKGVSLHKATGKWRAEVAQAGVTHYLGLFTTREAAAARAEAARSALHGEFSRTA